MAQDDVCRPQDGQSLLDLAMTDTNSHLGPVSVVDKDAGLVNTPSTGSIEPRRTIRQRKLARSAFEHGLQMSSHADASAPDPRDASRFEKRSGVGTRRACYRIMTRLHDAELVLGARQHSLRCASRRVARCR